MSTWYLSEVSENRLEGFAHLGLEPLVHFLFRPEVPVAVLHPLEVGRRHAAAVGEDVRHDEDAALVEDGCCASGVVGPLAPSTTILARIFGAFSMVIWFSSAAGMRTSTSSAKSCSLVSGSPPGNPSTVLCSAA